MYNKHEIKSNVKIGSRNKRNVRVLWIWLIGLHILAYSIVPRQNTNLDPCRTLAAFGT